MGDPRRIRSKYSGPGHPWQRARLEEEKQLKQEYGLVNKKEIYKTSSQQKGFANQAKKLIASTTPQSEKESQQLISKMSRLGLLPADAKLDDVLSIKIRNILDRRLQTIVFRKKLARSIKQSRQFITHRHIIVADRIIDVPGYIVPTNEEQAISFSETSNLSNAEHPERIVKATTKTTTEQKPESKPRKERDRKPKRTQKKTEGKK